MRPFCIRAYKIAVGCCTLLSSSSIITVELLAYRVSRSRSVRYSEPHSSNSSVSEPHTRNVNELHTVSEPRR